MNTHDNEVKVKKFQIFIIVFFYFIVDENK
jgi:hypothetical protein